MKKSLLIMIASSIFLAICSCDNFLDVTPEDKLTEEQIASSEAAINSTLNGIYMNMSRSSLYGENLTKILIDVMAQRYVTNQGNAMLYQVAQYEYGQQEVKNAFSGLWSSAYAQILDINEFIALVENVKVMIPENRKNILLGEAYALRAFHHFDLLRVFGPVYNTADSTSLSIPYNDKVEVELRPLLPANEVMDKVLKDLSLAEELLQDDPIITRGVDTLLTNDPVADFYTRRHYRMNYYAVKAVQARAWLWRGNKTAAQAAARAVLNAPLVQSGKLFSFLPYENIIRQANPDRLFSTEVIFGLDNQNFGSGRPDMYTTHNYYFSATLEATSILRTVETRLSEWFEANDYRYRYTWLMPGSKNFRTFFKFERPEPVSSVKFAYFQPLIRISEMYYIVAECESNLTTALNHLNKKIRPNRGLSTDVNAATPEELNEQLQREYIREFYGEGQLFFYYKRRNVTSIPNGSQANVSVAMSATTYRVPLPESETNLR